MPFRDDHTFLSVLGDGLSEAQRSLPFSPRPVSVLIHGLIDSAEVMTDLFDDATATPTGPSHPADRAKWERVSDLMDDLRTKLGPQALSIGPTTEVPGGYVGAEIAFGRIPDEEDFSGPPVADDETHFVSV